VENNNVVYQPNAGDTSDGPLDTTSLFIPTELGYKHNVSYGAPQNGLLQTAYATPSSSVWNPAPSVGSVALGDATAGIIAYDDFYGNIRPATKDRGAIQIST